jgi:hypothetical protein
MFFTNDMTSWLALESNPEVGSSRKRTFGLVISWLATLRRRFCPPLMPFWMGVPTRTSAAEFRPKAVISASMRFMRSTFPTELGRDSLAAK